MVNTYLSTLFIFGLYPDTRARELGQEFERYGKLVRCDIPRPKPGHTTVNAFIEYETRNEAELAFDAMSGKIWNGQELKIAWARDNSNRRNRDFHRPYESRSNGYRDRSRSPPPYRSHRTYSDRTSRRDYGPYSRNEGYPPSSSRYPHPQYESSRSNYSPSRNSGRQRDYELDNKPSGWPRNDPDARMSKSPQPIPDSNYHDNRMTDVSN